MLCSCFCSCSLQYKITMVYHLPNYNFVSLQPLHNQITTVVQWLLFSHLLVATKRLFVMQLRRWLDGRLRMYHWVLIWFWFTVLSVILTQKNNYLKKKTTTVQICRLKNKEHKSMKQASYNSKYSLSASRTHHSYPQFFFLVGMLSVHTFYMCRYLIIGT